jgi:hypothetical protein
MNDNNTTNDNNSKQGTTEQHNKNSNTNNKKPADDKHTASDTAHQGDNTGTLTEESVTMSGVSKNPRRKAPVTGLNMQRQK